MQPLELSEVTWRLDDHDQELRYLREDLTAERQARHAAAREADIQRIEAWRREIRGESRTAASPQASSRRHEPVASSDRSRRSRQPIRRLLRGRIRDVEASELISRNTDALERFRESMDRHSDAADRHAEAADRHAEAAERLEAAANDEAKAFRHQSDVMRALAANLEAHGEMLDRRGDALLGAFANLAAEIRGWRNER
jgi:chromosome segregation ATPase